MFLRRIPDGRESLVVVEESKYHLGQSPAGGIRELEEFLEELDAHGDSVRQSLDIILYHQRLASRQLDCSGGSRIFQNARSLWKRYTLKGSTKPSGVFDHQIVGTTRYLQQLRDRRQEASLALMRLKSSLFTPCRIPPEIWSIIFQFTVTEDELYVRPNVRKGPLLLCRVCRYWRGIAISTPPLWNSISISRNYWKQPGPSLLDIWLRRSGCLPLSIEISISVYTEPAHNHHVLNRLLSYSERWRRLRVNLTDNLLQFVLSAHMPNLEILEFGCNAAISSLNLAHYSTPKLRTVSLLTAPLDPTPLSLPWKQLTHFTSRFWADVQSHLDILKGCPSLEKCRLHLLHDALDPPFDSPLVMFNLKHLEIVAFTGNAMKSILDRLVLPSLSELSFIIPEDSPACGISGWPKGRVRSLVERSACGMVKIFLKGIAVQEEHDGYITYCQLSI